MRNGDFSAVHSKIYDPLTGDVSGANRVAFDGNHIPQDRISPIATQAAGLHSRTEHPGAALGQNNYQKAQVREKTTDGFDAKVNYTDQREGSAVLSRRASCARWSSIRACSAITAAPANGGFAGTGTNTSTSTARHLDARVQPDTVLDVRGGLNYYHNVTATTGNGLNTSTDVGIPGANLDEFTSGVSQINIGGYSAPVLGFSASQPWDRSEKTWSVVDDADQSDAARHTVKLGGEWRQQPRHAPADAGCRRSARHSSTSMPRAPACRAKPPRSRRRQRVRVVPARLAERRAARPEGHRRARHEALGDVPRSSRTSGRRVSNVTVDLAFAGSTTHPLQGLEGKGTLANYDPSTNTIRVAGYGRPDNALNVKNTFTNFAPRTGVSWRLNDKSVLRAGYGASTIPFPDNRYAFNYPGEAELQRIGRQWIPARGLDGRPASPIRCC